MSLHLRSLRRERAEDYLRCILRIIEQRGFANTGHIALELNIKPSSVFEMLAHGAGPIVVKMLIDNEVNFVIAAEFGSGASELLEHHKITMMYL